MSELNWSEDYSVGIPAIDNEHKFLASVLNDMGRALDTHKEFQLQIISDVLNKLAYCIRRHFESEENFMSLNRYPEYAAHKTEHTLLLEQLDHFEKRFKESNQSFTEKNLLFLQDWLVRHVILHDCKFSSYYRGKKLVDHSC